MHGDWIIGFGALSALFVLISLDHGVTVLADRGLTASRALVRRARRRAQ
jgi:hypothetical protein